MSKEGYSPIKEGKSIWISLSELSEGNDNETALVPTVPQFPLVKGGEFLSRRAAVKAGRKQYKRFRTLEKVPIAA